MEIIDNNSSKKSKEKLPYTVFICQNSSKNETQDYKAIFSQIISDRAKKM